ncbi:MAG: radical SAM protein [Peptostreptococcaceae bacterium]
MKNKLYITKIALILTTACNMRCKYCFESEQDYKPLFMSKDVIETTIEKFIGSDMVDPNLARIELFGGEPLLDLDQIKTVYDAISKYNKAGRRVEVWITSNMFKTDKRILEYINNQNVPTKITASVVFDKECHDLDRVDCAGNGTYDQVYANILDLIDNYKNIYVQCHQVFSPKLVRMGRLEQIFEESMRMMQTKGILVSTNPVSQGSTEEDMYSSDEMAYIIKAANEHIDKYRNFITNMDDNYAGEYVGHWVARSKMLAKVDKMIFCEDLKRHITVGVDGNTHMCHRMYLGNEMESKSVANIFDTDIFEKHELEFKKIRENVACGDISYNDQGNVLVTRYSELGEDCTKCIAGSECHQCYVPMKGEHKNIKSDKDCIYTREKVFWKMQYDTLRSREENKILNAANIRVLETLISKEKDPEILELMNEVKDQITLNSDLLNLFRTSYDNK